MISKKRKKKCYFDYKLFIIVTLLQCFHFRLLFISPHVGRAGVRNAGLYSCILLPGEKLSQGSRHFWDYMVDMEYLTKPSAALSSLSRSVRYPIQHDKDDSAREEATVRYSDNYDLFEMNVMIFRFRNCEEYCYASSDSI